MTHLIDTGTLSAWMKVEQARHKKREPAANEAKAAARLSAEPRLYISIATSYEIERGLVALPVSRPLIAFKRLLGEVIVIGAEVANRDGITAWSQAARTYARGKAKGVTVNNDADVLIVATAQVIGSILVTNDAVMALLARVQDPPVVVEDWLD
ncbi:MAG: hypothetical protein A2138_27840 [Deltaproteobacteria bacterium RBG_16_71_12]|nr:MAG: hypothetical protein A2138_27840 [Deltaproteobacteria bacterium RBG_16_71_12]